MQAVELIRMPAESWTEIIKGGEGMLDEELRTEDRNYLIEILTSNECLNFELYQVVEQARLIVSFPIFERYGVMSRDVEIVRWRRVAHQLLVTIGWFPSQVGDGRDVEKSLEYCFELSRHAFGTLARVWHEKRRQTLFQRFEEQYIRYIDVLLSSRELTHHQPLPGNVLRFFSRNGSKYANIRISASRSRH